MISFALGFIATPISTRLFAPAELARVSMFGTYTSLFCSVCYLGLDQAFVRFFRETPGRMTPRALMTSACRWRWASGWCPRRCCWASGAP